MFNNFSVLHVFDHCSHEFDVSHIFLHFLHRNVASLSRTPSGSLLCFLLKSMASGYSRGPFQCGPKRLQIQGEGEALKFVSSSVVIKLPPSRIDVLERAREGRDKFIKNTLGWS